MKKIKNTYFETPSQTSGPFLHIGCTPNLIGIKVFKNDLGENNFQNLTPEENIFVSGTVFDGNEKPVLDVMLETWQCNSEGKFEGYEGFQRVIPNMTTGQFSFQTIKPGFVKGVDGVCLSPQINFWIHARGINQPLITKMYFDKMDFEKDYILKKVKDKSRFKTLLAKKIDEKHYLFNIKLQGKEETIFFDF